MLAGYGAAAERLLLIERRTTTFRATSVLASRVLTPHEPDVVDILLVEDSPGDIRLTQEALKEGRIANRLHIALDGEQALAYLRREGEYADEPRPGLILLDLNLPRMDGREVLRIIKTDPVLRRIPVVVLTTSSADEDIASVYDGGGNCYLSKPVEFDSFIEVMRSIEGFWLTLVRLPRPVRD